MLNRIERCPISISFNQVVAKGELVRIIAPRTVVAITEALPLNSRTFLWKEEIYFDIPVAAGPEKARSTVQPGDIAYWPPGKAFCIFFGKTQPYSAVNIIGKITSDLEQLRNVRQGEYVKVRVDEEGK